MRIVVAGGTGLVGSYLVAAVRAAGHEPNVISRSNGVDLTSGQGLDAALAGASAVIDVSNVTTTRARRSAAFFESATANLLAAGERARVGHHVTLSIVGIDQVNFGYYEGKRRQERLVLAAALPASVLRATQFHEFADQILHRYRGPVAVVPRMRSQPVAAREVAAALVELATAPAQGMAPELAGPEVLEVPEMARQLLRVRGSRRLVVPIRLPGAGGRAMAGGGLLPTGPGPRGRVTYADWLAEQRPSPAPKA